MWGRDEQKLQTCSSGELRPASLEGEHCSALCNSPKAVQGDMLASVCTALFRRLSTSPPSPTMVLTVALASGRSFDAGFVEVPGKIKVSAGSSVLLIPQSKWTCLRADAVAGGRIRGAGP